MKTLNRNFSKTILLLLIAAAFSMNFSCEGPPGDDGMDGIDGVNGTNGEDGQDGQDGNVNVTSLTFDVSTQSGSKFNINIPQFTEDIVENAVILNYLYRPSYTAYFQIPGISNFDKIETELLVGNLNIYFYERIGGTSKTIPLGEYEELRTIIIAVPDTKNASRLSPLEELEDAGIDITNYYEVAGYYSLSI